MCDGRLCMACLSSRTRKAMHNPVVESTIDALASIANSGMYSEKEKQAAALDILLYAFTLTIYSAEEAIGSLNGQLEAALEGRTCHD